MDPSIVMETVDSDELKPYLKQGEKELLMMTEEMGRDNCILPDSCGCSDRVGPSSAGSEKMPGEDSSTYKNVPRSTFPRGPQSDLLGVLEELEREAEREVGAQSGTPPTSAVQRKKSNPRGPRSPLLPPEAMLGNSGPRPVHSKVNIDGSSKGISGPLSAEMLQGPQPLAEGSAQLPLPPPPDSSQMSSTALEAAKRDSFGSRPVLSGRSVLADPSARNPPAKPGNSFSLEKIAHQHLLDLAVDNLSPPTSAGGEAHRRSFSASAKPSKKDGSSPTGPVTSGPKTQLRKGADKVGISDGDSSRTLQRREGKNGENSRSIEGMSPSSLAGESSSRLQPPASLPSPLGQSPSLPTPSGNSTRLDASLAATPALTPPALHQQASPSPSPSPQPSPTPGATPPALTLPKDDSRDALQKSIYSTMSPPGSGVLAALNGPLHDTSSMTPDAIAHATAPAAVKGRHRVGGVSMTLLPSPPGLRASGSLGDGQSRSFLTPRGSEGLGGGSSRIPRSPVDGISQSMDLTGLSMDLPGSRLPRRRSGSSSARGPRGSKIPSPAGGKTFVTPRPRASMKRDVPQAKQGHALENATAELDKLAALLRQMQEDIKAIPADPPKDASHPLPTSPVPGRSGSSRRRENSASGGHSGGGSGGGGGGPRRVSGAGHEGESSRTKRGDTRNGLGHAHTPRKDGSPDVVPGVDTPDNVSLDKADKLHDTATTVTITGHRRTLHDAVAMEASESFGAKAKEPPADEAGDNGAEAAAPPVTAAAPGRGKEHDRAKFDTNKQVQAQATSDPIKSRKAKESSKSSLSSKDRAKGEFQSRPELAQAQGEAPVDGVVHVKITNKPEVSYKPSKNANGAAEETPEPPPPPACACCFM